MRLAFVTGAALLALSACARDDAPPEANFEDQMQNEMMANEMVMPPPPVLPADTPVTDNATPAAAEPPPVISQDDIQDDADASGMTARLPSDDETAPANATEE